MKKHDPFELIALFGISLFLFTWGISSQEIIGFDSRFYLFAQEMWRNGISFFPTTYDKPYADYPATATILIYITAKLFGGLNKFTAILPSAIAASFTVVITYMLGAVHEKRWGLYSVFFLLLTFTFLSSARSISLDMYPTLFTVWCFYLTYTADQNHLRGRVYAVLPIFILSFIFRGPIGLVIPTGVVTVYYLLEGNYKKFFLIGISSLFIMLLSIWLMLSIAYSIGGNEFVDNVLRMQVLGRISNNFLPYYFYFTDGLLNYAISFPVAVFAILGILYYAKRLRHPPDELKLAIKLFAWVLVILVGMSIPGDKKIRYILPMMPAVALIAAYPFIAPAKQHYFAYLRLVLLQLFLFFPILFIFTLAFIYHSANFTALSQAVPPQKIILFLLVMQVLCIGIFFIFAKQKNLRESCLFFIITFTMMMTTITIIEPVALYLDKARDLVVYIEKVRTQFRARLVFYKEKPDSLPIKYILNMPKYEKPIFITQQQELFNFREPVVFVTSQEYFEQLPKAAIASFRVIAKEKMGHVPIVVFSNR